MSEKNDQVGQIPTPENGKEYQFPVGMRVLAVDDDIVCLQKLAALLRQFTVTTEATKALKMLRENKDNFDIVITDVQMLEMDGFRLLEIISLEMDIPVIMMSSNDDIKTVMKGIEHGARDYLLKPIRVEEIKNIWQHVIRKTLFDPDKQSIPKGAADQNPKPAKRHGERSKVKEAQTNNLSDDDSLAQKRQRIAWTRELRAKFCDAVKTLGVDKAVPKKILELMNEPGITRENVASHLQKFRNAMKKNDAITIQQNDNGVVSSSIGGHLPNTTILSFDNQGPDSVHCLDGFGVNGHSNSEMIQFSHHVQNPETFSIVSQKPLSLPTNQQGILQQRYPQAPEIMNQMWQTMNIPRLGNSPSHHYQMGNLHQQSDFNGLKYQTFTSRLRMVDDLMDMDIYSHIPSYSTSSEPGPSGFPLVGCTSNSHSIGVFLDAGSSPSTMLRDASTDFSAIAQNDSVVRPQNVFPGQYEGSNNVSCMGRGGLDFRGQITGVPLDMQGSIMEEFIGSSQMKLVQQPPEHLKSENNLHFSCCSSTDDDLNAALNPV
ncbi:hypothetical protein HHK36_026024 [Tetracentron sinense]|uniref:Response regulatory domain-containing protein n=1 Tax=Tetracentron sinense TaxID=13715 RepID=A0A834YJV3_TETSI|nr:hypothetical protein HHK36_026024 [Tetracentron sinense]